VDIFPKPATKPFRHLLLGFLAGLSPMTAAASGITFAESYYPGLANLIEATALHAPQLQFSEWRLQEREGDRLLARAQRRPNAHLHSSVLGSYETREDIPDGFRGDLNANLTVRQPLYRWGALELAEAVAGDRMEAEVLDHAQQARDLFMGIREAYLQWLLLGEQSEVLEQSLSLSRTFVEARKRLLEAGQYSEQDVLEMEARLLENEEALAWARTTRLDLEHRLARMTGVEALDTYLQETPLERIQPLSAEALDALRLQVKERITPGFEEERWELLSRIEADQMDIIGKQTWPQFDMIAGIFSDQIDAVNEEDAVLRVQYFAGLQVTWNFFDSGQNKARRLSALARKRAHEERQANARENREREAEGLVAKLGLNLKQIEARQTREQLLERRVRLLREQAQRDLITGVELIEGEIDYLDVRRRLMQARVDYLLNLMRLGLLLELDPAQTYYPTVP